MESKEFKVRYEKLRQLLPKHLRPDVENLRFIYDMMTPDFGIAAAQTSGKSLLEAIQYKNEGNKRFQKGDFEGSFALYSAAILKCPQHDQESKKEFSILYANRSATLYHMTEYLKCISDVDYALKNDYPKRLTYKILDRKARCHQALKHYGEASSTFKQTIAALDDASDLTAEKRQGLQKDVQLMLLMLNKMNVTMEPHIGEPENNKQLKVMDTKNKIYKAITSNADIVKCDKAGRYAAANSDIPAGSIVLIEDAHCAVLLQKYEHVICHHCFKRVKVLQPCCKCANVSYCSEKCAAESQSYHQHECRILGEIWNSQLSVTSHIALRIISQKPFEYFKGKRHLLQLQDKAKRTSRVYKGSDYENVFNLVSHQDRRDAEDLLERTCVALFLLRCLKATDYFGKSSQNDVNKITDDEVYIAHLLLHHLQILQFNAHEISELEVRNKDLNQAKSSFIGGAVFPTLALFNHSCNPSVVRYFDGRRVIVRTIRPTKAGEQLSENYGPMFTQMAKLDRIATLERQYWFTCECEACINEWPTLEHMDEHVLRFRCQTASCAATLPIDVRGNQFVFRCEECSNPFNVLLSLHRLQETDKKFKTAKCQMSCGKIEKALDILLQVLNVLTEILAPPLKDYHLCQQQIRTCYLNFGNVHEI